MLAACLDAPPETSVEVVSPGWREEVEARIASSEYIIRAEGDGLEAANRAQDVRVVFDAAGASVHGRTVARSPVSLRLAAWGREVSEPAGEVEPELGACESSGVVDIFGECGRRAEYARPGLVEWWENRPDGIEQGFTVTSPPDGDGPLRLEIEVAGAETHVEDDAAVLVPPAGDSLRYAGVVAWDERGVDLPARLVPSERGLTIEVDDEAALGVITIDPLLTTVAWTSTVTQSAADFGSSLSGAGDVNGDGYGDVIIGAPYYDNGQTNEGRAYVYLGTATGLATTASWIAESNQTNVLFGSAVSSAGDINDDGYDDVIVGEPNYTSGQTYEGRVAVYHGSATGLATSASWTDQADSAYARMGTSVAAAGDVNADGYDDVIVGLYGLSNGEAYEGGAWVYAGSATGLGTAPLSVAEAGVAGAGMGWSVAGAGDVDNDGYDDVLLGAPFYDGTYADEGWAQLYRGSSTGLEATPTWEETGGVASAYLGYSLDGAGDVDGDGYDEIVIGAYGYRNGHTGEGAAFLYAGSAGGPETTATWSVEGGATYAYLGTAVSGAGDVDGDGYDDVAVGGPGVTDSYTYEGAVYLYYGSSSGLEAAAGWSDYGDTASASYGTAVAGVGDINGDGYADLLASSPDNPAGAVRLYLADGRGPGLEETPAWSGEGGQTQAYFGGSVDAAGDVNGDGYGDVIVGAYGYDNGQTDEGRAFVFHGSATGVATTAAWTGEPNQASANYGFSVSTAGDVNNDGYDDVIVGAYDYDNGNTDEGGAWLYLGSASGVATASTWHAECNQNYCDYGRTVTEAGDLNGDGYDDIAVGAHLYTNGSSYEGAVFVYHGSGTGPATSASWVGESNVYNAAYAFSVASGNFNGDAYSDIIVGDPNYGWATTRLGRVFVYHGSATGLASSASWTADASDDFGWAVAAADVNGDGYDDVLVGTPDYGNGETSEGRVQVYHGQSSGPSSAVARQMEGGQTGAFLGYSLDSAGDVNADGYDDVIVGAYGFDNGESGEGQAVIYLGSSTGIVEDQAAWAAESDYDFTYYGIAVSGAGDVNGDGYDDVIVGGTGWYNGHSQEGRADIFYGRGNERTFYVDADDDGYGDATAATVTATGTILAGYSIEDGDCDDTDRTVHPGAVERCDGSVDEDCDGLVDDDDTSVDAATTLTGYVDADGDGYGTTVSAAFCILPAGYASVSTDCVDTSAAIYPGAADTAADGTDSDCDSAESCYQDSDGDNYRTSTLVTHATSAGATGACTGSGRAASTVTAGDCADSSAAINPGATEVCDASDTDEDCDGLADDDDSGVAAGTRSTFYADTDGDGYGGSTSTSACDLPSGHVTTSTDCVDTSALIHPAAADTTADGTDSNCDASESCYQDADADGYRTASLVTYAVSAGATGACSTSGRAASSVPATDCEDGVAAINPGADEVCDSANVDEDCDGTADDADASTLSSGMTTWHRDGDSDGYGGSTVTDLCDRPSGYVSDGSDCDDASAGVHPGAADDVGDGEDSDCDGVERCYADEDADGYRSDDGATIAGTTLDCSGSGEASADALTGDCDDSEAGVNPGAEEGVGDEVDSDCDGGELCFVDEDGDGYRPDEEPTVSPDTRCVADGEATADAPDGDCDDADPRRHPGAEESDCTDPTDYNCDGSTGRDDADADGHAACEDCDDASASVNPGASEECNGVDDDCDDAVDEGCGDTDEPDSDEEDSGEEDDEDKDDEGCSGGCSGAGHPAGALALGAALVGVAVRRRRGAPAAA